MGREGEASLVDRERVRIPILNQSQGKKCHLDLRMLIGSSESNREIPCSSI